MKLVLIMYKQNIPWSRNQRLEPDFGHLPVQTSLFFVYLVALQFRVMPRTPPTLSETTVPESQQEPAKATIKPFMYV